MNGLAVGYAEKIVFNFDFNSLLSSYETISLVIRFEKDKDRSITLVICSGLRGMADFKGT